MKISHECPNSIFDKVQKLTDYDYCLVHLYEENSNYKSHFIEAKKKNREILLDNSIFELGEAFNSEDYVKVINELDPDWYILPDVLEDCEGTITSAVEFLKTYSSKITSKSKTIGVIQGKNYEELLHCYISLRNLGVDKIGISFDYSYFRELLKEETSSKEVAWCLGRLYFVERLVSEKHFDENIPLHLLGCSLPQEFSMYPQKIKAYIDSVDTSNPIVHGLKLIPYFNEFYLNTKESVKLFTLIDSKVDNNQWDTIEQNIKGFKKSCNN